MAQHSKKDQIASAALPLFLSNGFKGTSVDMVVKAAGVSKPTVYNHFPDKTALLAYVMEERLAEHPAPAISANTVIEFQRDANEQFFNEEILGLYAIVIGEGKRTDALVGDLTEPALDKVQPRTAGGREVHMEPSMPLEP